MEAPQPELSPRAREFASHLPFALDETTAEALHAGDAEASRAFLLRHLPRAFFFGETKREPWRLSEA